MSQFSFVLVSWVTFLRHWNISTEGLDRLKRPSTALNILGHPRELPNFNNHSSFISYSSSSPSFHLWLIYFSFCACRTTHILVPGDILFSEGSNFPHAQKFLREKLHYKWHKLKTKCVHFWAFRKYIKSQNCFNHKHWLSTYCVPRSWALPWENTELFKALFCVVWFIVDVISQVKYSLIVISRAVDILPVSSVVWSRT